MLTGPYHNPGQSLKTWIWGCMEAGTNGVHEGGCSASQAALKLQCEAWNYP